MAATRIRTALTVAAWAGTAVGAAGVVLHYNSSSLRPLVLLASGAPYLMVVGVPALAAVIVLRRWVSVAVATAVVAAAIGTQAPLYIANVPETDGRTVRVMQSNLLYADGADPDAVVAAVRDRNIDVLTVDELTPEAVAALDRSGLDMLLPHRHLVPGELAAGTGIWSRYPLSDTATYDGFVFEQLSATAAIPGSGPVTVYAFHPVPPVFGTHAWADELSRLSEILERTPAGRPAVVGGDFNATYDHAQYRALLAGRFEDAVAQAGAGNVRTYPMDRSLPPLIGIDRVLVAGGTAVSVDTVELPGADHRAVVAQIEMGSATP